jgi:hypothetical protein
VDVPWEHSGTLQTSTEQELDQGSKKRYSTSMERKWVLDPKYPCQLVTRILRKCSLRC